MGLIYAVRGIQPEFGDYRKIGIWLSLGFIELILLLFFIWLINSQSSYMYSPGLTDPPSVIGIIVMPTAGILWWFIARWIDHHRMSQALRRFNPFQCVHCAYDLHGNIAAVTCPECGQSIDQPLPDHAPTP